MARRGRKPKTVKRREPNGKPSRRLSDVAERLRDAHDREERDTLSVALEARQRVYGVPPQHTKDQMAGSFVGRLCQRGNLTRSQYEAAMSYLEDVENYRRAVGAAIGTPPRALDPNGAHGSSNHENVAFVQRSVARYTKARDAVQEKQNELRGSAHLLGALQYLVVDDVCVETLVGDLRLALNALVKHYGLVAKMEAA